MKRKLQLLFFLIVCLSMLFPAFTASAEYKWPNNISIGSASAGTSQTAMTSAWGALIENKTGAKVRIVPDPDPARVNRAIKGETDLLIMDLGEISYYYRGIGPLSDIPKSNLYVLWMGYDPPMAYMVAGDSELNTIYDIKKAVEQGKRIRVGYFAPAPAWTAHVTEMLPAFLGIKPELLTPVGFGSVPDMSKSIHTNKADVVCAGLSGAMVPELMAAPKGIKWLEVPVDDKEGWKRALDVLPTEWPGQTNTWGVPEVFRGLGCMLSPQLYFTTGDKDEELVYNIAKFIHQNFDEYKDVMAQTKRMSLKRFREFLDISAVPCHPGTVRYLKEIGQWTTEDDAWNEVAKANMQKYVDAWKEVESQAKAQNISVKMGNKKWEAMWADKVKELPVMRSRYQ